MNHHSRHRAHGRTCHFESLESRMMMAGDVIASVIDSTLYLTGDPGSNRVAVDQQHQTVTRGDDTVVCGIDRKPLTGPLPVFTSIHAEMKGGDDGIRIDGGIYSSIYVDVGAGYNNVLFAGVTVTGDLTIKGTGTTAVDELGIPLTVGGHTTIAGGDGNYNIGLAGHFHSVSITTGAGEHWIAFGKLFQGSYDQFTAKTLNVSTGGGHDHLLMRSGRVTDHIFADLGGGDDFLDLRWWDFRHTTARLSGGAGNNGAANWGGVRGEPQLVGFHV
jgi:hypothetical protein